jgi:signal transduction histidine kinase
MGRLAAGVVHDFNNLLAVFDSGVNLLEKQLAADPSSPRVGVLVEELRKRVRNGGVLTQQLLAFSRRQSLSPELTDINKRIESLTALLEGTLGGGITICRKLDASLGRVQIDPDQLDVAILNLAINARDAMDGSGTLTIETSDRHDDVQDVPDTGMSFIRVTVADTGCGMSKEILAQVFEPFFTTKPVGQGTGLGLSQVYGFVNQSGGNVRIDTEVSKGTRVHLFLPSAAVEAPA